MYFHTKGGTCSVSYRLIKLVSYLWQVTAHRSSCLSSAVNKIGRKSNTKFEKWAEVALTSMPWRKCKAELFSWNADCLPNVTAFARKTIEKTCKLPPNSWSVGPSFPPTPRCRGNMSLRVERKPFAVYPMPFHKSLLFLDFFSFRELLHS